MDRACLVGGEELHTCQLVSRETPETMIRMPGGRRDLGALQKYEESDFNFPLSSSIPIVSLFVMFTARSTLFSELDYDAEKNG